MSELKFRVMPGAADAGLVFALLSDADDTLLTGGPFVDRDACLAAIQAAAEALTEGERCAIREGAGGTFLELTAADGALLARSAAQTSRADAETLLERLAEVEQEDYAIELPAVAGAAGAAFVSFTGPPRPVSADDYDFARASASGLAGFEVFENPRDSRCYFHFNDAQGNALLYSRGFSAGGPRSQRMRAVALGAVMESRYAWREESGRYFFVMKARNGQEIARSRLFASAVEGEAAAAWLRVAIAEDAARYAKRSGVRKRGAARYDFGLVSLTGAAGFEMVRHAADRLHYFLFNEEDGQTLLFSPGYKTAASRDHAVRTLLRLGANPARYDLADAKEGAYFVVRAGNRQAVARSRGFADAAEAQAASGRVQRQIPALALAYGVALEAERPAAAPGERLLIHVDRDEDAVEIERANAAAPVELAAGAAAALPALAEIVPAVAAPVRSPAAAVVPAPEPLAPPEEVRCAAPAVIESIAAAAPVSAEPIVIIAPAVIEPIAAAAPVSAEPAVIAAPVAAEPAAAVSAVAAEPAAAVSAVAAEPAAAVSAVAAEPAAAVSAPAPVAAPVVRADAPPVGARTQSGGMGRFLWAIPLLLLVAFGLFALSRRSAHTVNPTNAAITDSGKPPLSAIKTRSGSNPLPPPAASASAPQSAARSAARDAADAVESAAAAPVVRRLGLEKGSMEAALAAYLADGRGAVPQTFTMRRLVYPPDSHEVNAAGKEEIHALARTLRAFPTAKIEIQGSSDSREQEHYTGPNPRLGYPLSKLRADCICRRLHFLGVGYDRLAIRGNGPAVAEADNAAARQRNRRADIVVTQR